MYLILMVLLFNSHKERGIPDTYRTCVDKWDFKVNVRVSLKLDYAIRFNTFRSMVGLTILHSKEFDE